MWKQFIKWFAGKSLEDPAEVEPDDVLEGLVYGRDSSVPMDPRLLRHDGWGPVRRRRPGEEIESVLDGTLSRAKRALERERDEVVREGSFKTPPKIESA